MEPIISNQRIFININSKFTSLNIYILLFKKTISQKSILIFNLNIQILKHLNNVENIFRERLIVASTRERRGELYESKKVFIVAPATVLGLCKRVEREITPRFIATVERLYKYLLVLPSTLII